MLRRLALITMSLLLPCVLQAQWVSGVSDDASVPRSGAIRLGISAQLADYDRRFARSGDGALEPLGSDFGVYDVERLPDGALMQDRLRVLTGMPNLTLTLGDLDVRMRGRAERVPVTLELGLFGRFALGVTVPIVRTRSTIAIGPGIGTGATAGINPALTLAGALANNSALTNALALANRDLRERFESCAGSIDPSCDAVNADRAATQAFLESSELFKLNLENVYLHSSFVPVAQTPADLAIAARLASLRTQFQNYGVGALAGAPARPIAAAPIAQDDLQALITQQAFGILADPLVTVERTSIGDVEAGGKLLLINRIDPAGTRAMGMRLLVGGLVRLGTGSATLPRNLVAIPTGDGQTDIEALAIVDVVAGRRLALTATARHTRQLEDEISLRVPDFPGQPIILATNERLVARDLGDVTTIEAVPRLAVNEFLAIAGYYSLRRKTADRHESLNLNDPEAPSVALLDPSVLDVGTEFREHRVGFGVGFSNLAAYGRGRARFPWEVSYLHMRSTRGSGGVVPRTAEDRLQLKLYVGIWR